MKSIMIIMETQERMQGVIRGIEELDEDHTLGIIHGSSLDDKPQDEILNIIADLANATIVKSPNIHLADHPQGKHINVYNVEIPQDVNDDRDSVKQYLTKHYDSIVNDLNNIG